MTVRVCVQCGNMRQLKKPIPGQDTVERLCHRCAGNRATAPSVLRQYLAEHPAEAASAVAAHFGVSRQRVHQVRGNLPTQEASTPAQPPTAVPGGLLASTVTL